MNVIVTKNIYGNLHALRAFCNENGFADYLLGWERLKGMDVTIAVFRMPSEVKDDNYRLFE